MGRCCCFAGGWECLCCCLSLPAVSLTRHGLVEGGQGLQQGSHHLAQLQRVEVALQQAVDLLDLGRHQRQQPLLLNVDQQGLAGQLRAAVAALLHRRGGRKAGNGGMCVRSTHKCAAQLGAQHRQAATHSCPRIYSARLSLLRLTTLNPRMLAILTARSAAALGSASARPICSSAKQQGGWK